MFYVWIGEEPYFCTSFQTHAQTTHTHDFTAQVSCVCVCVCVRVRQGGGERDRLKFHCLCTCPVLTAEHCLVDAMLCFLRFTCIRAVFATHPRILLKQLGFHNTERGEDGGGWGDKRTLECAAMCAASQKPFSSKALHTHKNTYTHTAQCHHVLLPNNSFVQESYKYDCARCHCILLVCACVTSCLYVFVCVCVPSEMCVKSQGFVCK